MTRSLGLDVGGSAVKVAVLEEGTAIHTERIPLPGGPLLPAVTAIARRALERHGANTLGVGLAGLVTYPDGVFVWGPHLPDRAVPFRAGLTSELGFEVAVDNDANLAALAEHALGAGSGASPLVVVTLGSGIGVGIVIEGGVFRGAGFAGELGHMQVTADGERCACGRSGCWETEVSGSRLDALARHLIDPDGHRPSGADLVAAAGAGDEAAVAALAGVAEWFGRGLVTLILAFDPALIVVGGAAAAAGPLLLDPARETVVSLLPGADVRSVPAVVSGRLGEFAGAMGAALAGRQVQNGSYDW
ncbi:MAG TPA: ROK family protein [Acidimicrobiia bacterium]|nr:ROK family protein [Acidimicrobiia bacterium]